MAIPSDKTPEMAHFLEKTFGRSTAILTNTCSVCKGGADEFRDDLSRREYSISDLCQKCQDSVFRKDDT